VSSSFVFRRGGGEVFGGTFCHSLFVVAPMGWRSGSVRFCCGDVDDANRRLLLGGNDMSGGGSGGGFWVWYISCPGLVGVVEWVWGWFVSISLGFL